MILDNLLQSLLPKDKKFFDYFQKDVENLLTSALVFKQLMSNGMSRQEREQKLRRIEELEHKGDEITHQIFNELGSTFITPFDREDIHSLASKLDDILDAIQGASTRMHLYRIEHVSPEQEKLAELIHAAVVELHAAIPGLSDLREPEAMGTNLVRIHSIENEADDIFERAIANLFDTCKDPIELIKSKEIIVALETATDRCEDAADVISGIMVKNA